MSPRATAEHPLSPSRLITRFRRKQPQITAPGQDEDSSHWIHRYGDLAYDLAASLLWSTSNGTLMLKRLYLSPAGKELQAMSGSKLERAAVFRELIRLLRDSQWRYKRRLTTAEQRMLDANRSEEARLRQFDSYLHRLSIDDLSVLLLKDKLGLPLSEVASALETPEGTLQMQRQQAFESLCDWIWERSDIKRPDDCYKHQGKATAYWDGSLSPAERTETEKHLAGCGPCTEFHERMHKVIQATRNHPRLLLPAERRGHRIANDPVAQDFRTRKLRFSEIPWFFRTGAESLFITLAILLGVALIPRVQRLYEASVNQRLDTMIASSTEDSPINGLPAERAGKPEASPAAPSAADFTEDDGTSSSEDLAPVAAEGDSDLDEPRAPDSADTPMPGAGPSEVWRFSLRTSSPKDIRLKMVEKLTGLGATPENTPGMKGVEAPGGIQFNLVVDRKWLGEIRKTLKTLNGEVAGDDRNTARTQNPLATSEPLKWYRSASKTPLPAGKTRIIIWLSQI